MGSPGPQVNTTNREVAGGGLTIPSELCWGRDAGEAREGREQGPWRDGNPDVNSFVPLITCLTPFFKLLPPSHCWNLWNLNVLMEHSGFT